MSPLEEADVPPTADATNMEGFGDVADKISYDLGDFRQEAADAVSFQIDDVDDKRVACVSITTRSMGDGADQIVRTALDDAVSNKPGSTHVILDLSSVTLIPGYAVGQFLDDPQVKNSIGNRKLIIVMNNGAHSALRSELDASSNLVLVSTRNQALQTIDQET